MDNSVLQRLKQRPPFLFVDRILDQTESQISTQLHLSGDEDFFKGHFPGQPIMPGVLLLEAIFQTGALLMGGSGNQTGVVTKVEKARFKHLVRPGDTLVIDVSLIDRLANAYFFKGSVKVAKNLAVSCEFTCAQIEG